MSTLQNNQLAWPIKPPSVNNTHPNKYEKCLIITEEIYKRINITFEIKKLESSPLSGSSSESIDSNDLSNETDLFAYDKSSSISSSDSENNSKTVDITLNNNEESKFRKAVPFVMASKPKKRFRKRARKRMSKSNVSDTDCSSDEQLPLSRIAVDNLVKSSDDPDIKEHNINEKNNMDKNEPVIKEEVDPKENAVINIIEEVKAIQNIKVSPIQTILEPVHTMAVDLTKRIPLVKVEPLDFTIKRNDNKPRQELEEIKHKVSEPRNNIAEQVAKPRYKEIEPMHELVSPNVCEKFNDMVNVEAKEVNNVCHLCNASFKGSRGLKRHITMSHIRVEGIVPNM